MCNDYLSLPAHYELDINCELHIWTAGKHGWCKRPKACSTGELSAEQKSYLWVLSLLWFMQSFLSSCVVLQPEITNNYNNFMCTLYNNYTWRNTRFLKTSSLMLIIRIKLFSKNIKSLWCVTQRTMHVPTSFQHTNHTVFYILYHIISRLSVSITTNNQYKNLVYLISTSNSDIVLSAEVLASRISLST